MFKMSDKTYNTIKYAVVIFIPALTVAISALIPIYNWGEVAQKIVDTLPILQVFLGTIFCISSAEYNKKGEQNGTSIK